MEMWILLRQRFGIKWPEFEITLPFVVLGDLKRLNYQFLDLKNCSYIQTTLYYFWLTHKT